MDALEIKRRQFDSFGNLDKAAKERVKDQTYLQAWKLRAAALRYAVSALEQVAGTPKPLSEMTGTEVLEELELKAQQLENAAERGHIS